MGLKEQLPISSERTIYSVILSGFHRVALSVNPTFRYAPCGAEISCPFGTLYKLLTSIFPKTMEIIYEDNHIIAVNKTCGEIVQGDKTGDKPLPDLLKAWLKEKYAKPGNVFVGVTHRLDRPVSGVVLFAKTTKSLARLNEMFRLGEVKKTYWAIVKNPPPATEGELVNWLVRNEKQNKSYACDTEKPDSKKAVLHYKLIARSENYCRWR
ncbi:Ribosomal large subunit pseudouridine synthase C [Bacteroidales bacterium Barb7]|nr:Ribosomal large subunit pseudouridine synthase C [Bacteroidales bacterium Barb7]